MTGHADTHALQRSIAKLTIGAVRDVAAAQERKRVSKVTERTDEFQIEVAGLAADTPLWQTGKVAFDNEYVQLDGARYSDLERPQVLFGFEQTIGVSENTAGRLVPVMPSLIVIDWTFTAADHIEGCEFACCAIAPGDEVRFEGFFHLTINGYGAPFQDRDSGD